MVKLTANIKQAVLNLLSSKLRSLLALLGILVGTASVVAMISGGELATREAIKQFKTLGTDLMAITINDAQTTEKKFSDYTSILTLQKANSLIRFDEHIIEIAPYTQLYHPIQFQGHSLNGSILGITESFTHITHVDLATGRFISTLDGYANFCVIGQNLYQAIKKITFNNPLGQQLQVGSTIFKIIGVAKSWPENSFVYANIDNAVMIPLLTSTTLSKFAVINNVILRLAPDSNIDDVKLHLTNGINQDVPNKQLFFRSAKEMIARMTKQSDILTLFLGLIGSISLIVGGIGVMNIMLVSVVERRREIGIRLAVGARPRDIRLLFLVEAIMLSLVGGTFGVIIGMFISFAIAFFSRWEFSILLWPPFIGFSVSVATGIFFGFYPAYQASLLEPIDALRTE